MNYRKGYYYINNYIIKIRKSDIGYQIAKGLFWTFTGTSLAKIIVLLSGVICARILGKNQYGEFSIIRSTISMFVAFGSVGLGLTATKYISEYRNTNKSKILSIYYLTNISLVITGSIIAIIVLLLSPYICDYFFNAPYLIADLRLGALLLFVTIINTAQNGTLAGFEDFKAISINTLIDSIFEAIFMNIGAYYYGTSGAIFGFGFGYIIFVFANYFSIKANFKKYNIIKRSGFIDYEDFKILYKFSLPAALSSLIIAPTFWLSRSILIKNSGFGEAGIYEIADQWKVAILFLPGAISQIILPILSNIVSDYNSKIYIKTLIYNVYINGGVALFLSIIVSLLSGPIIKLYGAEFDNVWPLIILAFSTVFTSLAHVAGISIASNSKMWIGFGFNLFWSIMLIFFTYLFIEMNMAALGLSLAVLCSYIIHSILQFVYLYVTYSKKSKNSKIIIYSSNKE